MRLTFDDLDRRLPVFFLLLSLTTSLFLAWNVPPFMGADEPQHFMRADLTTLGKLTGERSPSGVDSGGEIDGSIVDAANQFNYLRFRGELKVSADDYTRAAVIVWDRRLRWTSFANTATCPPIFYLPQSAAVAVSKTLGLSVVQSLYFARAANALVCTAIGFIALMAAGRARAFLATILLLPMSLALYATATQDGVTIVVAALAASLIARGLEASRPLRVWELAAAAACLSLVAMTKLPFLLLCSLVFFVPCENRTAKLGAAFGALVVALGWHVWMQAAVQTDIGAFRPDLAIDAKAQLSYLLSNPLAVFSIAANTMSTFAAEYIWQFIGVLGSLDTFLPATFYSVATVALLAATATIVSEQTPKGWAMLRIAVLVSMAATVAGIFAALYLTFNVVGGPVVEGVQGRYFLPLAVLVPLAMGGAPLIRRVSYLGEAILLSLMAFLVLVPVVVERSIILRNYLD